MDAIPEGGTRMKSRSRKVMIITAIGMIIMVANGRGDQRADEKGEMTDYLKSTRHEYNAQKETSKLESGSENHETCMIEIKTGKVNGGKEKADKEEKQRDFSRKRHTPIQYVPFRRFPVEGNPDKGMVRYENAQLPGQGANARQNAECTLAGGTLFFFLLLEKKIRGRLRWGAMT